MIRARGDGNSQVAWLCTYFPPKVVRIHSTTPHIITDFWDLGIRYYSHSRKGLDILQYEPPFSPQPFLFVPWNSCSAMNKLSRIIRLFKGFWGYWTRAFLCLEGSSSPSPVILAHSMVGVLSTFMFQRSWLLIQNRLHLSIYHDLYLWLPCLPFYPTLAQ